MTRRRFASGVAGAAGLIAVLTLLARATGFARVLVFADAVRAGGVGEIYQSVNALPNVLFEIAAGGILAAVAVPLIATRLGAGDREAADRLADGLLTWTLLGLAPLAVGLFAAAPAVARLMVAEFDPDAQQVAARLLRIFAVQVPLYGIGIILTGLLHAHRRFLAAALAPLLSSVVVLASYIWYGRLSGGQTAPSQVSDAAIAVLGWGTTAGVVVLSLPLIVPALRTGWRWRPTPRFPHGTLPRIAALAGAGVLALLAQQVTVLISIWLTNHAAGRGAFSVYQYVQAVYLLPYAVLAVPVATSTFPALAESTGAGEDAAVTLRRSLQAVLVLTGISVAVLVVAAPSVGGFFGALDARRGASGASPLALGGLAGALTAYAPGLVGFGAAALLTRALYVRGHALAAGCAIALGWLVAGVGPLLVIGAGAPPGHVLATLGLFSTAGMTLAAVVLGLLVRRAWGLEALRGTGRLLAHLVIAVGVAVILADFVRTGRSVDTIGASLLVGVGSGTVALVVAVLALALLDRERFGEILARGRAIRGRGER